MATAPRPFAIPAGQAPPFRVVGGAHQPDPGILQFVLPHSPASPRFGSVGPQLMHHPTGRRSLWTRTQKNKAQHQDRCWARAPIILVCGSNFQVWCGKIIPGPWPIPQPQPMAIGPQGP